MYLRECSKNEYINTGSKIQYQKRLHKKISGIPYLHVIHTFNEVVHAISGFNYELAI